MLATERPTKKPRLESPPHFFDFPPEIRAHIFKYIEDSQYSLRLVCKLFERETFFRIPGHSIRYLLFRNPPLGILTKAKANGKPLYNLRFDANKRLPMFELGCYGNVDALQWLYDEGEMPTSPVITGAVINLEDPSPVLDWAINHYNCWNVTSIWNLCIEYANIKGLEWLLPKIDIDKKSTHTCKKAVFHMRLDVLTWARSQGFAWDIEVYKLAIQQGKSDIIKYIETHGKPRLEP
jgi:hypothetical protein